jgi:hypothetical protein
MPKILKALQEKLALHTPVELQFDTIHYKMLEKDQTKHRLSKRKK